MTTVILAIGFLAREFLSYKPDVAHYFLPEAYILGGSIDCVCTPYRVASRRSRNFYQRRSPITRIERYCMGGWIESTNSTDLADLKSEGLVRIALYFVTTALIRPNMMSWHLNARCPHATD